MLSYLQIVRKSHIPDVVAGIFQNRFFQTWSEPISTHMPKISEIGPVDFSEPCAQKISTETDGQTDRRQSDNIREFFSKRKKLLKITKTK